MKRYEEYIEIIERLFEENRAPDAERVLLDAIAECDKESDYDLKLRILNELIGFYRQTSEKDKLIKILDESIAVADKLNLTSSDEGKIIYATTALNVATGYRSIGELDKSEFYYGITADFYEECLNPTDMLYAGLFNNMSLLKQEKGDFVHAMEYLKRALEIVTANDAGFETAVTYANLANTAVLEANAESETAYDKYNKAKEYAYEAIRRFESRGTIDPHYCAALSALGLCFFYEKEYGRAAGLFEKAMNIVERSFGRNSQYMRLKENRDMCNENRISGMQLSKLYYEKYGKELLEGRFADYLSQMAVGLVGEGSDCYGYDDLVSTDHDWGPDFCIWIPGTLYEEIGEELQAAYDELPNEFMGYKRIVTERGAKRRGVICLEDFYINFLGTDDYEKIDWKNIEDYRLAAVTNGEIFHDWYGEFSKMRNKLLEGYPEPVLYLKIADDFGRISQTGQYNYARMIKRNDRIAADLMLGDCIKQIMLLAHHMNDRYPMHDKWLHRSFLDICGGTETDILLTKLHTAFTMNDDEAGSFVSEVMEELGKVIAKELYDKDIISDISSYLDEHTDELVKKSRYAALSDDELVRLIARTEFEAFDKVKNEGGRASCQNNWPTFSVMRRSQYLTWDRTMLLQYIYDFEREYERGHNLITEKYGRMMESTAPEKYDEIKDNFEPLSEQKKMVIEQICAVQIDMLERFGESHPSLADNTRSFHTYEDNMANTSYETYLRGEISTYSDKMLQLYGRYVVGCLQNGINIAEQTITNTAKLYGFASLEEFEKSNG